MRGVTLHPRLRSTTLALAGLALAAGCATAPVQTTPRGQTGDLAGLHLIGLVTVARDTVRFDRPRSSDPLGRQLEEPRVESGEVRATVHGQPYRLPVEDVSAWLHQEPESNRTMLVATAIGLVAVASSLVFILGGGF